MKHQIEILLILTNRIEHLHESPSTSCGECFVPS